MAFDGDLRSPIERYALRTNPIQVSNERTTPALEAHGLSRRYRRGAPWALHDLTVAIEQGSVTGLVGPNGAGKSTLLRCWVGFERPDSGDLAVGGVSPIKNRANAVAQIGFVPQASAMYRDLTVQEHFRFASIYRPLFSMDEAMARVRSLGIDSNAIVRHLSGGEQAQVMLTTAFATNAPILILDEPLANLDPLARRDFFVVMRDVATRKHSTIVMSSHVVSDVKEACDSLVVLSHGRLALQGRIESLMSRFRITSEQSADSKGRVADFADERGELISLVESPDMGERSATLEEVVLGHLAAARERQPGSVF